MKKITVLIPAYNEAVNLPALHSRLCALAAGELDNVYAATESSTLGQTPHMTDYEWEFLFVNDGSRDNTLAVLNTIRQSDSRVTVVDLARNFGKENALLAGFDLAVGDAVVVMDADLQHPAEVVPEMVRYWELGYVDVYGRRRSRGHESWLRHHLTSIFYKTLQSLTSIEMMPGVGDFRLLDRRAVNALTSMRESQRYTKGMFSWIGGSKYGIDFDVADRAGGKSSFGPRQLFALALQGITGFTTAPLRFASISGITISIGAFIYLLYALIKYACYGDPVRGFATLLCVMLLLGGLQLLCLGIIGEYIGRIFIETKGRPPYIIDTVNGKPLTSAP